MNTEEQLRDTFRRLVPTPPEVVVEPAAVKARAQVVRRRRLGASLGACLVATAAVVAALLPAASHLGSDRPDPGPAASAPTTTAPDPWRTSPCRSDYPDPGEAVIPTELASVRLCDLRSQERYAATRSPSDALVAGLPELLTALRALPTSDPAKCAAANPAPATAVLVFTASDGSEAVVPATACAVADVDGRQVDATGIHLALLTQLSQQRDELDYGRVESSQPGNRCGRPTAMLIHPAIDDVVAAAACTRSGQQVLGGAALASVRTGWQAATQSAGFPGCGTNPAQRLMLETSYGDLIHFVADDCGEFVQTDAVTTDPWRIVVDYATLTHIDS